MGEGRYRVFPAIWFLLTSGDVCRTDNDVNFAGLVVDVVILSSHAHVVLLVVVREVHRGGVLVALQLLVQQLQARRVELR